MEEKFEIVPVDINSDMHNHTRGSDGRQSSLRFLLRAAHNGKNIISMADHDSVRGYKNLENDLYAAVGTIVEDKSYDPTDLIKKLESIKIMKGTELITSYNGVIIEVLGYNFDIDKMEEQIVELKKTVQKKPYEALYEGFSKIIEERKLVFDKSTIDEAFEKIKTEGKGGVVGPFFNELIAHPENHNLLTYIDEEGQEKQADTLKLFINKHLYNKKSPLFVDMSKTRPSYEDTIQAIHNAGGKAVLAHAGRYNDKFDVREHIDDMIAKGLDGLEVYYPDHSDELKEFLLGKVREHGLIASGGSDDHHSKKEGVQYDTGKISVPNIPETEWIQQSIENGLDFIRNSEAMQESIKRLKELREQRRAKIEQSKNYTEMINAKEKEDGEKEYE